MAKRQGVSLPSSQGGLLGGVSSSYKTNVEFGPKFVIILSLAIVVFIFILFKIN
jgi:hypothetical protein